MLIATLQVGVAPEQAAPVALVGALPPVPHWHSPIMLQVSPVPHVWPHEPQFVVVPSAVSQPVARMESQSAQPLEHIA